MTLKDRVQASVGLQVDLDRHQEIARWLVDTIGLVNFFISNPRIGSGSVVYHFYDEKDAFLFKLKFGGE